MRTGIGGRLMMHAGAMDHRVQPEVRAAAGFPAVVAVAAILLLLAGCSPSEPQDAVETRRLPPPGAGPWDQRELAVYREALRQLRAYEARHQRFLAAGKATRAAKVFYQDRLVDWESTYAQLQQNEREGIRIARGPVVISSEPVSIKAFQDNAADVVVHRCTDQSDLGMTQGGEPLPAVHEQPVVQEVDVRRSENLTWRIGTINTTDRPCAR
jgi:hypothetical protein